eukprot:gene4975-16418_t
MAAPSRAREAVHAFFPAHAKVRGFPAIGKVPSQKKGAKGGKALKGVLPKVPEPYGWVRGTGSLQQAVRRETLRRIYSLGDVGAP